MKLHTTLRFTAPLVAACLCTWGASSALPKFPLNTPWPEWTSWSALVAASIAYLAWFYIASCLIGKASRFRRKPFRLLAYSAILLLLLIVPLAPLLPAYAIFGVCHLGLECGASAQGAFNVMNVAALQLPIWVAMVICIAFVSIVAPLSRMAFVREGAA